MGVAVYLYSGRGCLPLCVKVCPPLGTAFNQLAALAGDKNEYCDAAYYYWRRFVGGRGLWLFAVAMEMTFQPLVSRAGDCALIGVISHALCMHLVLSKGCVVCHVTCVLCHVTYVATVHIVDML